MPRRSSEPSTERRTFSGEPSITRLVGLSSVGAQRMPNFVAIVTSSRRPAIALPTSCSFVNGPYISAVSSSVQPRSSARWIVAIASRLVGRAVERRHAHAAEPDRGRVQVAERAAIQFGGHAPDTYAEAESGPSASPPRVVPCSSATWRRSACSPTHASTTMSSTGIGFCVAGIGPQATISASSANSRP